MPVYSGVPQGSVCGPMLFIVYVNDIMIPCLMEQSLYVDDILLYCTPADYHDLQGDVNNLCAWLPNASTHDHI